MYLDRHHIRLLKKISRTDVVRTDKYDIKDIEYLRSEGLVSVSSVDKPGDFFYQPFITEKGKAVLWERTKTERRANIAIVLSILALILSFLTAFTPFSDWSRSLIERLIQSLV